MSRTVFRDEDEVRRERRRVSHEEDMNPDEFRKMKYGVDGTKIFICQVTPGVFTLKVLGKQHGATNKKRMLEIIGDAITDRFGIS